MDFIRHRKERDSSYLPDEVHSFFGEDADLLMLALSTHEHKFVVVRESNKKQRSTQVLKEAFQLVDFALLRQYVVKSMKSPHCRYIDQQFSPLKDHLSFAYSLDNIIDDFILTLFRAGNDFIPCLPTLQISEGALDYFFSLYFNLLPTLPGYITETNASNPIHFDRLASFLHEIGKMEQAVLNKRLTLLKKRFKNYRQWMTDMGSNPKLDTVYDVEWTGGPIIDKGTGAEEEEDPVDMIHNQYVCAVLS